ncbi:MAG: hypothetical protein EPN24_05915 [Candidatus Methanoperedens sp.]|nr:MAG: hypothetical protein EPN24_05915 [Candidatus Methanoperedens sp.]
MVIAIGFLRWLFNYQREEIQLLLESRGINISTGEISNLSEEFLLRFYVLHKKHYSQTKEIFEKNGGYVLHLDGSAESGDEMTFTAKEGITGFTIDSWIMPSESSEYIKPFLVFIREKYGKPLAVVRDMSEQIKISVSEVFPGVSQQVCHYHFVRNLGDIIFKHLYQEFRRDILKTNALARILALKKICMDGISSQDGIVIAEHHWVMLGIEYVLYPREKKSDYPFVLPYLEVMNRLMEVLDMLKKIVMWNARHNIGVKVVLKFEGYLQKLAETTEVKELHSKIKVIWGWFEKIRKVLRVSREFSTNEQDVPPTKANEVKLEFNEVLMKIRTEGRKLGDKYEEISKRIFQNCHDHMDELFVEVKDIHGGEIRIIRNNGIEELNHRWSRMHIRRRTGRSRTTMEMEMYGALLAVFSNIENEEYIKTVLDDVKDFAKDMQDITEEELLDARKLIRTFPQSPLIRSDAERPGILQNFIKLIDDEFEDVSDREVEAWLSNF